MHNLPSNWQVKSLGEIFNLKQGKHLPLDVLTDGAYPVFGANGKVGYYDKFMYEEATLLVTCRGATCGSINLTEPNSWVTGNAIALVPQDKIVNSFFYYQLKNQSFRDVISGSAQPQIIVGLLKNKKIFLPPLPIQKQIAEIIEKADQAKQKLKGASKLTDEFLQSVFIEMFGDPVKNPKGWEKKMISEISKVGTGGTPSRENPEYFIGNIPWVKTTEVNNNRIFETEEKITEEALNESNCTMFPKSTVLIALYGQGLTRGRASILEIEACSNQACVAILPSKKINSVFLWRQLLHFYSHLRSLSRGGNQPNLNLSFIKNLKVIFPPLSLQQQFAEIVNKTEALKEKQKQSEQELENLFQSLMQRAFKGELVS